jgi:hypothetical protein
VTMIGNEERFSNASSDTVVEVVLGVDTHLDVHVAVALDQLGREAWTPLACPPPRKATRISLPGRRASEPLGALGWREPAAMRPDSLVTLERWGSR